jgi:elongation factor G
MDRIGADLDRVVGRIQDRLRAEPVPLQIPIGAEDAFRGVVDVVEEKAIYWDDESLGAQFRLEPVPAELAPAVEAARERVIEAAADFDDALAVRYLEGEAIEPGPLRKALREATLKLRVVPVLCGSAFKNKGVQPLLDAIIEYLPSPLDVPPIEGEQPRTGKKVTRKASDDEPFSALAFKIMTDKHVGTLTYVRVYSGTVETGQQLLNVGTDKKERVGRLLQMHANKRQDIEDLHAGDIAAIAGLKKVRTGDTLADPKHPVLLEPMEFPEPVISIAIEAKTKADMDKLGSSLERLAQEDPSFRVSVNDETAQTIISGMGELHLEIIVDRLVREFGVSANVGAPQVAFKETVTRPVRVEGRYIKQTGGSGDYGVVVLEVEPGEPGSGFSFETAVKGGSVPREYFGPVRQGCEEAAQSGELAGFPVVDVKVRLVDGQVHEVDSSERSFKIAASLGMREALRKAEPVLLEPIMDVEVVTPEEFVGGVQGDLNARRGQITGIEARAGAQVIRARVPLATMFGYVNNLRSMTQGRATYTMQFSQYARVPETIAAGIAHR